MSDAADIARLTSELGYEVAAADVEARLGRLLSRSEHLILIAEHEARAVGWVHVMVAEYIEIDRFAAIAGLVVDSSCRRSGIGRMLMERAEQWARDQGCSIVRLSSSTPRSAAHRFYEQLGYANVKTQYTFAKSLDATRPLEVSKLVPRVPP